MNRDCYRLCVDCSLDLPEDDLRVMTVDILVSVEVVVYSKKHMSLSGYVDHVLVELKVAHLVEEAEMKVQSQVKVWYLNMDRLMLVVKVVWKPVMAMSLKEVYRIEELLVMEVLVKVLFVVVRMGLIDQCLYVEDRIVQ